MSTIVNSSRPTVVSYLAWCNSQNSVVFHINAVFILLCRPIRLSFFFVIFAVSTVFSSVLFLCSHCIVFYVIWAVLPDLNKWMDGVLMLSTDSYFIKAWNGFHSDIVFFYCYCFSG